MTIALAWVATRSDGREDLCFASDSRTRGARILDLSPKILMLPRSDCAICFAGETSVTYPLMLQISNTIAAHQPARERNLDISEFKSHLLRVLTDTMASVTDAAQPLQPLDAQLIFGGYSWRLKTFQLWTIYYEEVSKSFRGRSSRAFHERLKKAAFIGDWAKRYRSDLVRELNSGVVKRPAEFEPLGVLARLLRSSKTTDTVGGAPQVVRIGPHMNTRLLCVLWGPDRKPCLFGRTLFEYENCDYWSIDPDSGVIGPPRNFVTRQASKTMLDST